MLGHGNIETKRIFSKHLFWAHLWGLEAKSDFSTYLWIENSNSKFFFVLYTSSTDKFIEKKKLGYICILYRKNRFFIFSYLNFRVYLWALIHKRGYIRSRFFIFFWILHSWINNPTLALFWEIFYFKVETPQKRLWNPYFKTL